MLYRAGCPTADGETEKRKGSKEVSIPIPRRGARGRERDVQSVDGEHEHDEGVISRKVPRVVGDALYM